MLNVSNDSLHQRLKRSEETRKKTIEKAVQTRMPPGFYSLAITGFESTCFLTEKYGEVTKITLYLHLAEKQKRPGYYPLREEFPFFIFTDANAEEKCPQFDYLLAFCRDAFGKIPSFSDGSMEAIVAAFEHFFGTYMGKAFYGIVIHREEAYRDKIMTLASLFRNSVRREGTDPAELKRLAGQMNKHWKLSGGQKKKLLQKQKHRPGEYSASSVNNDLIPPEEELPDEGPSITGRSHIADDLPF